MKEEKIIPPFLGTVKDKPDSRDYKYEDVMGGMPVGMPSFTEGYDVEERFGVLPDNSQGSASDCVGEGGTADMTMAIRVFTNEWVYLSPRDAYSQIYQSNGGSSPREFYKLAKNVGICEDRFLPTRPGGQYLTETFARKRDDLLPNPIYWKIENYYSINSNYIKSLTQAIFSNHGCGGAYFPHDGAMGHFIFFRGYGTYKGYWGLKYRDTYAPFTKWIYLKDNRYYLQDNTPIDLAGLWTCFPGDWTPYKKKEITEEKLRRIWVNYPDIQKAFPRPSFISPENPNYSRQNWAKDNYDEYVDRAEHATDRGVVRVKGTNYYFLLGPGGGPITSAEQFKTLFNTEYIDGIVEEITIEEARESGIDVTKGVPVYLKSSLWLRFLRWISRLTK